MLLDNSINSSTYKPVFGYGRKTRELIKEIYPYCALTGKRYGSGPLRITTDHIRPHHYGGLNVDSNYLFITRETNSMKKCTSLKRIIMKYPEYFTNLMKYFEALLNSENSRAIQYAQKALNTVLEELSGISSNVKTKNIEF